MDTKREHCNIMQSQPTPPPPPPLPSLFSIQTTKLEYSNYPKIFLKEKIVFENLLCSEKCVEWNRWGNYHEDKMIITMFVNILE